MTKPMMAVCAMVLAAVVLAGSLLLVAGCRSEAPVVTASTSVSPTSASPPTTPIHMVSPELNQEWSPPWPLTAELAAKMRAASMLVPVPPTWEAATYSFGDVESWHVNASAVTEIPDGTTRRELVIKDASGLLVIQLSWYESSPMPTTAHWEVATVRGSPARVFNTDTGAAILIEWQEGPETVQAKLGLLDWKVAIGWLDTWIPVPGAGDPGSANSTTQDSQATDVRFPQVTWYPAEEPAPGIEKSMIAALMKAGIPALFPTAPPPLEGQTTGQFSIDQQVGGQPDALVVVRTSKVDPVVGVFSHGSGQTVAERLADENGRWKPVVVRGKDGCWHGAGDNMIGLAWEESGRLFYAEADGLELDAPVQWLASWKMVPEGLPATERGPTDDPSLPREDSAGRTPADAVLALLDAGKRHDWQAAYSSYARPAVSFETFAAEWEAADSTYHDFLVHETRVVDEKTAFVRVTYRAETTPPGGQRYPVIVEEPGQWWRVEKVDGLWKVGWLPVQ